MKQIIIASCILLTIQVRRIHCGAADQALRTFRPEDWRKNVEKFVASTIENIGSMEEGPGFFCKDIRKRVVLLEKLEIFKDFDFCDRDPNDVENCYFKHEKKFHEAICNVMSTTGCNLENLCIFWNYQIKTIGLTKCCRYYKSWNMMIDIWTRCSLMKPVIDTSKYVKSMMTDTTNNKCIESEVQKMDHLVHEAWNELGICKNLTSQLEDFNFDENEDYCYDKAPIEDKFSYISLCYDKPLKEFIKFTGTSRKNIDTC